MSFDIGNLWSGAAGAILVAIFTVVYTEVRESRQAVRELAGLARLLGDEIQHNEQTIQVLPPSAETANRFKEILRVERDNPPSVDAWLETRARLAQGLEHEDFDVVAAYYRIVYELATDLKISPRVNLSATWHIPYDAAGWHELTDEVKKRLGRYAYPSVRRTQLGF